MNFSNCCVIKVRISSIVDDNKTEQGKLKANLITTIFISNICIDLLMSVDAWEAGIYSNKRGFAWIIVTSSLSPIYSYLSVKTVVSYHVKSQQYWRCLFLLLVETIPPPKTVVATKFRIITICWCWEYIMRIICWRTKIGLSFFYSKKKEKLWEKKLIKLFRYWKLLIPI